MKIRRLENFRFPFFDPFGTCQGLAPGAMSVAAAIVSVALSPEYFRHLRQRIRTFTSAQ
jgi:hypothetical protein